jgi:menaquinol-cytochrome c reductase iron-sulfur subunit
MNENETNPPKSGPPEPPPPASPAPAPAEPELIHGRLQMEIHQTAEVNPEELSRRAFFTKLCIGLSGVCAVILGAPLVGFILAPLFRKTPQRWITLGKTSDFEIGKTVNVTFTDPSPLPWAGITAKSAAWLRRASQTEFIAFSVNCTHLGCPVRWLADAELFMCPCHGGVYYKDGTVAAGPPPHPLIRYQVRVVNDEVQIQSQAIPITTTLS